MFSDIAVLHREGARPFARTESATGVFFWETCLRKVAFGAPEDLVSYATEPGDEIFRGSRAFQLCLEIACGLRSPLIGETEVFGQFKKILHTFQLGPTPWELQFRRFLLAILEDAKKTRSTHLDRLGSQSYGSVARREAKGLRSIHVIGAGDLVLEMLPWLAKDGVDVHVHARDVLKAREFLGGETARVSFSRLVGGAELVGAEALVIAAPVSARDVEVWLSPAADSIRLVIDLRADSALDVIKAPLGARALTLADVMKSVDSNNERIQTRKADALQMIERLAAERARYVEYRPFGWEDVCA